MDIVIRVSPEALEEIAELVFLERTIIEHEVRRTDPKLSPSWAEHLGKRFAKVEAAWDALRAAMPPELKKRWLEKRGIRC